MTYILHVGKADYEVSDKEYESVKAAVANGEKSVELSRTGELINLGIMTAERVPDLPTIRESETDAVTRFMQGQRKNKRTE